MTTKLKPVERINDGFSSDLYDPKHPYRIEKCVKCSNVLKPGEIYLRWYTGGWWCEECGPKLLKENIKIDQKVLKSLTKKVKQ